MKKIVAALLSVCLCAGMSGCGKKETVSNDSGTTTLTWLVPGDTPQDLPRVLEKVNEKLEEKINVHLDLKFIDEGAYQEKMNTYMASSYKYDIAFAGYNNPMVNAASKGGIISIDELLEKTPDLKETIPDYAWELTKYGGKIYGVPNLQVLPTALGAIMDPELLKKYNYSMDDFNCIDDLEPYLETIKNNEPEYIPYCVIASMGAEMFDYGKDYAKVGNIWFKKGDDGKWHGKMKYETEEFIKGVHRVREWYEKGYIRKDVATFQDDGSGKEKYGVAFSVYKPGIETLVKNSYNHDCVCKVIQKPVIKSCNAMTVIGKDSKNPEKAIQLIELVNTDKELFNLLTLGFEGEHYKMVDENTFEYIGDKNTNKYFVNAAWKFGNVFNSYVAKGDPADVWEQTKKYNESAEISPLNGFAIDDKNIRTELSQIESLVSQYSMVQNGAVDPDTYYDEFLSKLKTAGSDKVVAEYERQVEEFMNNK